MDTYATGNLDMEGYLTLNLETLKAPTLCPGCQNNRNLSSGNIAWGLLYKDGLES